MFAVRKQSNMAPDTEKLMNALAKSGNETRIATDEQAKKLGEQYHKLGDILECSGEQDKEKQMEVLHVTLRTVGEIRHTSANIVTGARRAQWFFMTGKAI